MKILITGKNGFVGHNLIKKLEGEIIGIGRDDFDLTNREATNRWFKDKQFDVVIHTANVGGSRLKEDSGEIFFHNLSMFYNLLANQNKFGQLISFGSGAELGYPTDPYGLSKNIINKIIQTESKLNNIRIFGVFGEDEWDTRFIKSNIKRYINKEPLIIHQNKCMDFIYIDDLILLINHIIQNPDIKVSEANYIQSYTLKDIALLINGLDNYQCEIMIKEDNLGKSYIGNLSKIKLPYIGLEEGIKKVYEVLN